MLNVEVKDLAEWNVVRLRENKYKIRERQTGQGRAGQGEGEGVEHQVSFCPGNHYSSPAQDAVMPGNFDENLNLNVFYFDILIFWYVDWLYQEL